MENQAEPQAPKAPQAPAFSETPQPAERVFPIRVSILETSPFQQNASSTDNGHLSAVASVLDTAHGSSQPNSYGQAPAHDSGRDRVQFPKRYEHVLPAEPGANPQAPPTPEVDMTDLSGDDSSESQDPLLTDRFEYAVLADGSHGVVRGSRRAFTRCEDELIHIPGAIQAHGMLVALKRQGQGVFIPRIVSENSHYICHYQPAELFGLDNFNQVMPIYQRSMFNTQMKNVYSAYEHTKASGEPIVFDFAFFDPAGLVVPCWCAAHYLPDVDLFVCEFELQDYSVHPLASPQQSEPPNPIDTLGSDHMDLATVSSMHSRSQPVFISPEFLHQGADSISTSVEVVGIATKIQRQLSNAADIQALLDAIVGVVKELTRFSRVMIYQFDEDYNGTVVAELMDPKVTQDVYRGLHFPAADIPPQARRLYMINKVRVLFDREHETSRLVGRDSTDIRVPLDLTHAYLRAMSPVHLKYLANMEVRSSMSMSLESEGKLWGLIVCHSYGATATQVPFSIRELCYFIGVAASTCIEKLLNADKLQARRIVDILDEHQSPNECITASSDELLKLFEADCGFLVIEGEARTIGRLTSYTEAVTLLKYLFIKESRQIQFSSNIKADFRDLVFPSGFRTIAGVLYIPLSGTNNDCVVFYRKSQLREVHWAGKPSLTGKIGNLEPRNSFKKWTQVVAGTSKGWTQEQANMAAMAQLVYGSFIRVWREKETAVRETRLKRLLLHDASHQVRTPLNAVINYLEMALEKPLEETTKHALTSSYTASKSLIYVIDDLLNLTGSTTGSIPQLSHPFDVSACIEEALEPLKRLAREKGIEVVLGHAAKVSRYLRGDPPSLQRTISVLVANAIEQTNKGKVLVEWSEPYRKSSDTVMRIAVTDSGRGLSERDLDDMFQEFEQVPDEDFDEDSRPIVTRRDDVLRVGVGLAFVARYVKQRNGQLRVTSTKGKGSTFAIEIPFVIASRAPSLANRRDASPLPTLPMPPPPAVLAAVAASAVTVTPSGSSRSGVGMSPPIVAQTPSISPLDTAEQTPTTHYLNIIVADDNIINVQILERRLSKMGHRVLVSRDGQECYNTFAQNHATVDFVLMDLNMPVVDGWLSTRMIREHENKYPTPSRAIQSCGRTPIFAVSGMLRRNDEQRCMSTGFDGWMPKPVDMKRLAACLAGALDPGTRNLGVYDDAHFELGGWFPQIVEVGRFVSIGAVGGVAAGAASEPGASSNVATESLEEPPYTPATTTATVLGTIPETMESEASTSLQPQPQPQPTVAGPSTSPAESMAETARAMSPEARYHEAAVAADAAYQSYLQETWSEPDPDPYQGDEAQRGAGGGGGGEADVDPYSVWLGISNAPRTI